MPQPKTATNPNAVLFEELLKMKRREMKQFVRSRNTNPTKGINWLYPRAVERTYFKKIRDLMKQITDPMTEYVRENIGQWISEYNFLMNDKSIKRKSLIVVNKDNSLEAVNDKIKKDVYPDDLKIHIEQLEEKLQEIYKTHGDRVRTLISDIGFDISEYNNTQWKKFTKELIGIEFVVTEPWELEMIKAWAEENFTLIKSLSQEYIKKVNTIVSNSVTTGKTSSHVFKEMKKLNLNITDARTRLIARDQVGKLQGQFTQRRMTDAGLDMYIWVTAGDERVRGNPSGPYKHANPSHYVMSGKICRWDDATKYSEDGKKWKKRKGKMPKAHPGQEIRCRCTAIPYMADIIKLVDRMIEKEKKAA